MYEAVQQAIDCSDEPLADASIVPMYLVSKLAKTQVTVALGGDGGDEAFAGYDRYKALKMTGLYYRLPYSIRSGVAEPLARLLPESTRKLDRIRRLKRFLSPTFRTPAEQYTRWLRNFPLAERSSMYTPQFREGVVGSGGFTDVVLQAFGRSLASDSVTRAQECDISTYLPGDLMQKADRMSMAHGLELRSPFLDHELMEFAATIPAGFKLKGFTGKYLLKRAFADDLPPQVLGRRKEGFSVPISAWLQNELRPWMETLLLDGSPRIGTIVNHDHIRQLARQHQTGSANNGLRLWTLACLETFCRRMNVTVG